jgi:tetratricopeptide (TPR) repeat protein
VLLDGQDPGVWCLGHVASVLSFLGYPDQALRRVEEALTLAHELAHSHTLAFALCHAAAVYRSRGQLQLSQRYAEAWVKLAREQGLSFHGAWGTLGLGFTRVLQGQVETGMAQMRQGMTAYHITGAELSRPDKLFMLAVGYWIGGQPEEGLRTVAEALAVVERTGERIIEGWLWWVRGELTLKQFNVQSAKFKVEKNLESEAEECFWKAIEIARQQQAKSPELRATMSLARLWQQQGKTAEARQMLAEIYGWFTEGFDTVDLKEARGLLEELSCDA